MTCACSATGSRSWPTSGSSWSGASSTASSAERAGLDGAAGAGGVTPDDTYPDAPLPVIDPAQAIGVIVGFIRAQMEQTGFERLVIGLSGGVDSATVAFLAARAIGAENLLAVRMPYRTSSEASETDALRVVDALGCPTERVDISPMVDPMLALIDRSPSDTGAADSVRNVRRGNVMARAADDRPLRPIGRVRRARGRDLEQDRGAPRLRHAPRRHGGRPGAHRRPVQDAAASGCPGARRCPRRSSPSRRPPTCGRARPTRASWGARTTMLDRALYALVDRRWTRDRCVRAGLPADLVDWVVSRVARMEFKRQLPPVAKLSLRTPGFDHLYPRRRPGSRR